MTASQINPTMCVLAHSIEPSNDPTLILGQVTREKKNLWSIKLPTRLDGHFYISLEVSFPKPCLTNDAEMWFQPIASGCFVDVIYSTPHHSMELELEKLVRLLHSTWYLVPGTWYLGWSWYCSSGDIFWHRLFHKTTLQSNNRHATNSTQWIM